MARAAPSFSWASTLPGPSPALQCPPRLALWRGEVVAGPRAHLHAASCHSNFDLVVADRVGAARPIAEQILRVQLPADLVNGLLNRAVAEGGEVHPAGGGRGDLERMVVHRVGDVLHDPHRQG